MGREIGIEKIIIPLSNTDDSFSYFFCYSIIFLKEKSKKDKADIANGPYIFFKHNYLFFLQ